MDLLLMALSSLTSIHPIEARIQIIKIILFTAKEKKNVLIFNAMYDSKSVLKIEKELVRYLHTLENPSCYITQDDSDIDLKIYRKMFGTKST